MNAQRQLQVSRREHALLRLFQILEDTTLERLGVLAKKLRIKLLQLQQGRVLAALRICCRSLAVALFSLRFGAARRGRLLGAVTARRAPTPAATARACGCAGFIRLSGLRRAILWRLHLLCGGHCLRCHSGRLVGFGHGRVHLQSIAAPLGRASSIIQNTPSCHFRRAHRLCWPEWSAIVHKYPFRPILESRVS
ncbi:hypothetical protein SDC9_185229 [bioreactor metagenome]|uniref:Uncharacterized protein n=1 Tax=bioreactor metagenome TaxID=1076179 RepID=A0A645HHP1_9ZZZZ